MSSQANKLILRTSLYSVNAKVDRDFYPKVAVRSLRFAGRLSTIQIAGA